MTKALSMLAKLLAKLARLLFHRIGIIAVMILLQIGFYIVVFAILSSSPYYSSVQLGAEPPFRSGGLVDCREPEQSRLQGRLDYHCAHVSAFGCSGLPPAGGKPAVQV